MLEGDEFQPELTIPVILGRRVVMGLTFLGFGIESILPPPAPDM